jgi:hypothetical protein
MNSVTFALDSQTGEFFVAGSQAIDTFGKWQAFRSAVRFFDTTSPWSARLSSIAAR